MADPLVTVIVAAHNAEPFLRETLQSLYAQDFDSFETMFIDDGSTDGTGEIARSFPVRYHYQENRGPAGARNTGLAMARGELIAFLDADDLLPPTKLGNQARFLLENTDVDCVLGRQEWMNPPPWLGRDERFGDLDGVPLGSAMIRRRVFDAIGGFDETFRHSEDMDLLIRVREHGFEIEVLPEIVLYRRAHGDQLTANLPDTSPLLRSLRQKLERERSVPEKDD